MRTTIRLPDALLEKAKREADKQGITVSALVQQGLEREIARPANVRARSLVRLPVCTRGGGMLPGVELDNSSELLDRIADRN